MRLLSSLIAASILLAACVADPSGSRSQGNGPHQAILQFTHQRLQRTFSHRLIFATSDSKEPRLANFKAGSGDTRAADGAYLTYDYVVSEGGLDPACRVTIAIRVAEAGIVNESKVCIVIHPGKDEQGVGDEIVWSLRWKE